MQSRTGQGNRGLRQTGLKLRLISYIRDIAVAAVGLICIAGLIYLVVQGLANLNIQVNARNFLALGVIAGIIAVAALTAIKFFRALNQINERERYATSEMDQLRKQVASAEAILRSEPQILIFWEPNGEPKIVVNSLNDSMGVPAKEQDILRFRVWIEPDSVTDLEVSLNSLFQTGKAFNISVKTLLGVHLEADGRASGSRLILKFRDLAGNRESLAQIIDKHRKLTRDIFAHRALLDSVPMPVWFRKADGRIEWVNKAYAEIVDVESPETVTKRQIELLESRERKHVQTTVGRGEVFRQRLHTVLDGERRAFDVIVLSLGDESAGIAIDVEALESAEGDLDRHQAAHIRTLDRVSTAVAIFDADQKLTFFNQAYLNLWKFDALWLESNPRDGEILDRLRSRNILPEQADYRLWKERQLECYQSSETREDWWYLPDGRSILVVGEQRPGGGVTYLYDDVTERLELESRYNSLFSVQRETLENLREGVAVFGSDGLLKLYNRAFAAIWKLNWTELNDQPHIESIIEKCGILQNGDNVWLRLKRAVTAIYDERKSFDGQMSRSDGSIIDYACQPLPDGATLLTFVDVTDRKRVETMLIERNEALEAADRLKNDFIQNVSYELRTPLTSIKGFSELLGDNLFGQLNKKQAEYISHIQNASEALHTIIDQILDLATIDAGNLKLDVETVDVDEVIRAAAVGVRERLAHARIELVIEVDETVHEFSGDKRRISQILYNLLCNAVGFSEEGSVVRLICQREDQYVVFSVIDQGVGIPEDYQKSVFNRFETRSRGSKHRGAGLGLSMVKGLVELHGGAVILESEAGQGTTVKVYFPEFGRNQNAAEDEADKRFKEESAERDKEDQNGNTSKTVPA